MGPPSLTIWLRIPVSKGQGPPAVMCSMEIAAVDVLSSRHGSAVALLISDRAAGQRYLRREQHVLALRAGLSFAKCATLLRCLGGHIGHSVEGP